MKNSFFRAVPPLLPAFFSIAAGIFTAVRFPHVSPEIVTTLAVVISAAVLISGVRPFSMVLAAALAFGWGAFAMNGLMNPKEDFYRLSRLANGSYYTLTGQIDSFARQQNQRTRYVLLCRYLQQAPRGDSIPLNGRILFSAYFRGKAPPPLMFGDQITIRAKLRPVTNFANPGGFNYQRHLKFRGIAALASANAGDIQKKNTLDFPFWILVVRNVQSIRQHCHKFILNNRMPQAASVLSAMLLGKREGLSQELKDTFARAGVSHLLAISGLHLATIAGLAFFFFIQCFRGWKTGIILGRAKKAAMLLTLFPLCAYAALAGFSPATQRALIMTAVFVFALAVERETDPANTLSLAGIIILSLHPGDLFSISFQLSFAAVAVIIVGMAWVNRNGFGGSGHRIIRALATVFWVSLFAGLGTFILVAYYFNMTSHIQFVSNIIVVPLIGGICLPLGFLAMGASFIYPALAQVVLNLTLELIHIGILAIHFFASLPFAWARVITPTRFEMVLYYLCLTGIFALAFKRRRMGMCLVGLSVIAACVSCAAGIRHRFFSKELTVSVLSVGQGACTLVEAPGGYVVLLDCGGAFSRSGFNVGRYVVGPFLWRHRIKTIDLVVLSHPQADHMNGLYFIMENFKVNSWVKNRDAPDLLSPLAQLAAQRKIPVHVVRRETAMGFDRLSLTLFPARIQRDLNNNSIVCRLCYGGFSMLFAGDIEQAREISLVDLPLYSNVLVAPHHGAKGSSSKIFLDQVKPESVIVSCGFLNRYGFPHKETLARFRAAEARVFRTDIHGAVSVKSRGIGYTIQTSR